MTAHLSYKNDPELKRKAVDAAAAKARIDAETKQIDLLGAIK